jgi:Rps23 Pro-64 3,4-dihydroxylase Tpa1-like proline 4-hydroxylase
MNSTAADTLVDFGSAECLAAPFRHFVIHDFLNEIRAEAALSWLEGRVDWKQRSIDDFYETYDIDLRNVVLPPSLGFLVDELFLELLRERVAALLDVGPLAERIDIAAHKLVPGYKVKIHTDYGATKQSQRLLIQLNRGWSTANGGILMLFDEEYPTVASPKHKYYLPRNRSAFAFEISPTSFHAVSPVKSGDRYTLSFSFYQADGAAKQANRV